MTKAEEILEKHLKINDVETMLGRHGRTHKAVINALNEAINYTHCCTEFADGKCKPMVNADWTYLRCECGKRFEPKG